MGVIRNIPITKVKVGDKVKDSDGKYYLNDVVKIERDGADIVLRFPAGRAEYYSANQRVTVDRS
jgi:hypothetical protein